MDTKNNIPANPNAVAAYKRSRLSICNPEKRSGRKGCCLQLGSTDTIEYPDPAIYSQAEQLLLGSIPSWDNPDITTNNWLPFRLMPESSIKIHNLSPTVSAVNTLIHLYTSPFGIGMQETLQLSRLVTIAPGSEIEIKYPLPQAILAGDQRIGIHIKIEHPSDNNTNNNAGSQVHDGSFTTESGRNFNLSIPVLNNSNFTREIILSVMPTDLTATITPASHVFAPFEQITANLHVEVPGFLVGTPASYISRAVTVVGRLSTGELIGGATKLLRIDN